MKRVVGLGAGGHAKVVLDILRRVNAYEVVCLLDPGCVGSSVGGVPVLGGDEMLPGLRAEGIEAAFIGVGGVGDSPLRIRLFEKAQAAGFTCIHAIHPTAILAPSVRVGQGVTIMAGAIVNPDTCIEENVLINTGAIVEHDCELASHVCISPGAVLCGGVRAGRGAFIGAGATVRQYVTIGERAVVGAGAVVVKDVLPATVVVGVPARILRGMGDR